MEQNEVLEIIEKAYCIGKINAEIRLSTLQYGFVVQ